MTAPETASPRVRRRSRSDGDEIHHAHRNVSGGQLRPAVFGAMDGILSNVGLVAGVAGAHPHPHVVLLTGVAGLVAGSFSMASGEYVSVASQTELVHREVELERREIERRPHAEQHELAAMYEAQGLTRELAKEVAHQLSQRPDVWRIHARAELGVDPDRQPSAVMAAILSFVSFAIGAVVPILPYMFGASTVWITLVLSAVALLACGAGVARITAARPVYGALRQLGFGVLAAGVTYGVGAAIGVSTTG
jgi:VIT1/CCC1 family predicted Fe2+/Mn2+ transporter